MNEVERRNGEMVLGTGKQNLNNFSKLGGTPFMKYLTMHLKTTKRMQFKFKYTPTGYIRGAFRNAIAHLPEVNGYVENRELKSFLAITGPRFKNYKPGAPNLSRTKEKTCTEASPWTIPHFELLLLFETDSIVTFISF